MIRTFHDTLMVLQACLLHEVSMSSSRLISMVISPLPGIVFPDGSVPLKGMKLTRSGDTDVTKNLKYWRNLPQWNEEEREASSWWKELVGQNARVLFFPLIQAMKIKLQPLHAQLWKTTHQISIFTHVQFLLLKVCTTIRDDNSKILQHNECQLCRPWNQTSQSGTRKNPFSYILILVLFCCCFAIIGIEPRVFTLNLSFLFFFSLVFLF